MEPIIVGFPHVSSAEANKYAADLAAALREIHPEVVVERHRSRNDTQDFGATLAIVLGTASATAVANGIAAWLKRHSGASIEIHSKGNIIAKNLDSRDAAKIAEAFSGHE